MAEIALSTGIDAVSANPGFGDVEIDFHNPAFAPDIFDQQREPGFKPFAEKTAPLPEERIFGGLLADR